jgi:hypothetical protein
MVLAGAMEARNPNSTTRPLHISAGRMNSKSDEVIIPHVAAPY